MATSLHRGGVFYGRRYRRSSNGNEWQRMAVNGIAGETGATGFTGLDGLDGLNSNLPALPISSRRLRSPFSPEKVALPALSRGY